MLLTAILLFCYRRIVAFIDCYSHVIWVYLLHNKSAVLTSFQSFHKMIKCDANVKEYLDSKFKEYLDDTGTVGKQHV